MDARARSCRSTCVFLVLTVLAIATASLPAAPAQAAKTTGDAVEKVTNLNKKAIAAYNKRDYDEARAALREALDLCNSSPGLDKHPIKARTHIHLGVVNIVGFKQRDLGIKHFRKALEIQPDIKLTKSLSTPDLEEAFTEAQGGAGGGGGGSAPQASGQGEGGGGAAAAPQASEEGGSTASGDDEEERPRPRPRSKKKKRADEDEGDGEGEAEAGEGTGQTGRIFVALALGSGFGTASGNGELNSMHKLSAAGFAPAQLGHVAPEAGYFLSPRLLLSVQLRIQYVTGINGESSPPAASCGTAYCEPSKIGFAGFARATRLFGDSGLRWFLGAMVGAGNIRHVLLFKADTMCGPMADTQCVDTLKSGPLFLGPTAGLFYELGSAADLVVGLNPEIGLPNFTLNFDLNVGLAFRL
jgi:hypothetical protein